MAASTRADVLIQHIFQGGVSTYAVLDGARNARIHRVVGASGRPYRALYDGELSAGMRQASPYVVELEARHVFTRSLLEQAWGQSWGVFVSAPLGLDVVRRHLRRFLRVNDERGRALLFRYYDPRVLRVYLPTCTPGELETFFGSITRFVTEDADPSGSLTFERSMTGLSVKRAEVPAAPVTTLEDDAEEAATALAAALAALPSSAR